MNAEHWVEFLVWPRNGSMANATKVRIDLKRPICLYDEAEFSEYRKVRARSWKVARKALETSPSMPMRAEPHDWSDSLDDYQKRTSLHGPKGRSRPEGIAA